MVEDKKTTLYNFGLYIILIVILSAVAIALLRLFQIGVSVSYVIKISLPKIITGIKLLIAPTLAFLGAMITDPDGCKKYYDRLKEFNEMLDKTISKTADNSATEKAKRIKYKNIEFYQYAKLKNNIFSIMSFSLTLLSSIIVLSNIVNSENIKITYGSIIIPIIVVFILTAVLFMLKKVASCGFYKKIKM